MLIVLVLHAIDLHCVQFSSVIFYHELDKFLNASQMFLTVPRLSKASRWLLTPKCSNNDYYKGGEQLLLCIVLWFDFLNVADICPSGGLWMGTPVRHVVGGKAKYRLLEEKVCVFIARKDQQLASV